jgi:hypothetical protein
MSWKHLALSVVGPSHSIRNEPGQDYCRTGVFCLREQEFFIGLAADGAGSTANGGVGAEIACETLYARILDEIRNKDWPATISDDEVREWIAAAREAIAARSGGGGPGLRDYACTLIGVVATGGATLYFQIGDGCIVTGDGHTYRTIFWPEQGEYANTTFFITDEAFCDHIKIEHGEDPPGEIAIFTDGLQNLVLSFSTKTVHDGFFRPLFSALTKNPDNGFTDLSRHVKTLLSSDSVNARSDDDKTLILAVHT